MQTSDASTEAGIKHCLDMFVLCHPNINTQLLLIVAADSNLANTNQLDCECCRRLTTLQ